jgi:hypothetical protein
MNHENSEIFSPDDLNRFQLRSKSVSMMMMKTQGMMHLI